MNQSRDYATTWDYYDDEACPVCGLNYVRESEGDRRVHRARHRKVLQVYEPKPNPQLAALHAKHGIFVPLDDGSPRWLRKRLEGMATMFRRESWYDFAPYSADEEEPTLWNNRKMSWHWLIVTADGRSIGGLSARWREFSNATPRWMWAWVWIVPSHRRTGYAQRCWEMLKTLMPEIEPEPPFSHPIARFFAVRTDVPDYVREQAASQLQKREQKETSERQQPNPVNKDQ